MSVLTSVVLARTTEGLEEDDTRTVDAGQAPSTLNAVETEECQDSGEDSERMTTVDSWKCGGDTRRRASDLQLLAPRRLAPSLQRRSTSVPIEAPGECVDAWDEPETFRVPTVSLQPLDAGQVASEEGLLLWPEEAETARLPGQSDRTTQERRRKKAVKGNVPKNAGLVVLPRRGLNLEDAEEAVLRTSGARAAKEQALVHDRIDGSLPKAVRRYIACKRELDCAKNAGTKLLADDVSAIAQHAQDILVRIKHLRCVIADEADWRPVEEHVGPLKLRMVLLPASNFQLMIAKKMRSISANADEELPDADSQDNAAGRASQLPADEALAATGAESNGNARQNVVRKSRVGSESMFLTDENLNPGLNSAAGRAVTASATAGCRENPKAGIPQSFGQKSLASSVFRPSRVCRQRSEPAAGSRKKSGPATKFTQG